MEIILGLIALWLALLLAATLLAVAFPGKKDAITTASARLGERAAPTGEHAVDGVIGATGPAELPPPVGAAIVHRHSRGAAERPA